MNLGQQRRHGKVVMVSERARWVRLIRTRRRDRSDLRALVRYPRAPVGLGWALRVGSERKRFSSSDAGAHMARLGVETAGRAFSSINTTMVAIYCERYSLQSPWDLAPTYMYPSPRTPRHNPRARGSWDAWHAWRRRERCAGERDANKVFCIAAPTLPLHIS